MKHSYLFVIVAAFLILLSGTALAENNRDNQSFLNGKPFSALSAEIQANAEAIASIDLELQQLRIDIDANSQSIADLEAMVQDNKDAIEETQANLDDTNINLAAFRAETTADLSDLQGQVDNLQSQVDGLQTQITDLTAALALQLQALQAAVDGNTTSVNSLTIQVTSLTAQILLINTQVVGAESRLTALEEELGQLQILVASLDLRLISVESQIHTHGFAANCREILDDDPSAASGIYTIDPDGDGELEPMDAYCDMDNFEGGWTNLNFSTNQILLENGNLINCSTLSQDANSITCTAPLFNNEEGPEKKFLYHYYCVGTDPSPPQSADYLVDHVGTFVGHRNSLALGFSAQSNRYTGVHGTSDGTNREHCYIDGEVVEWQDARCSAYNTHGNGNCVPGVFTLTR